MKGGGVILIIEIFTSHVQGSLIPTVKSEAGKGGYKPLK